MRNQTWNQQGQIVEDIELYREAGISKFKNWLTGQVGDATAEEEAILAAEEQSTKREEARVRAITAIKTNATASPLGRILYDLALSQGWIEE